jgi:hypothetical protein
MMTMREPTVVLTIMPVTKTRVRKERAIRHHRSRLMSGLKLQSAEELD